MSRRPKPPPRPQGRNEIRIIAGEHRGRRLKFPDAEGLRPTPDRVRETVFNWLAAHVPGAHCLDLFAGSGALGFEALSRGAESVTWVEKNGRVADQLQENLKLLKGEARGEIRRIGAEDFLAATPVRRYELVFLDPPFGKDWLARICTRLSEGFLADRAWVYLESEAGLSLELPPGWTVIRDRIAGQVQYRLVQYQRA